MLTPLLSSNSRRLPSLRPAGWQPQRPPTGGCAHLDLDHTQVTEASPWQPLVSLPSLLRS
eukprot:15102727-Heterocapsa_arctica.AAC.1